MSGIACAVGKLEYTSEVNGVRTQHDAAVHCKPQNAANIAMAFIDLVLCVLTAIYTIFGIVYLCAYGRYFGIRGRYYDLTTGVN